MKVVSTTCCKGSRDVSDELLRRVAIRNFGVSSYFIIHHHPLFLLIKPEVWRLSIDRRGTRFSSPHSTFMTPTVPITYSPIIACEHNNNISDILRQQRLAASWTTVPKKRDLIYVNS
jgi:hypothetical protein